MTMTWRDKTEMTFLSRSQFSQFSGTRNSLYKKFMSDGWSAYTPGDTYDRRGGGTIIGVVRSNIPNEE